MELNFSEAVGIGRNALVNEDLETIREWFSLSYTRLANHLHTNSRTLKRWLSEPDFAAKIHDTTAARIGEFCSVMEGKAKDLLHDHQVKIYDLYPLSLLAGELGCSTTSPRFTEMCRTQQISCYDMGILGVYIPKTQAEALKGKK
jgi:fructose-1,6-bisphosphatase/inositol monophosphatase family enzyme